MNTQEMEITDATLNAEALDALQRVIEKAARKFGHIDLADVDRRTEYEFKLFLLEELQKEAATYIADAKRELLAEVRKSKKTHGEPFMSKQVAKHLGDASFEVTMAQYNESIRELREEFKDVI